MSLCRYCQQSQIVIFHIGTGKLRILQYVGELCPPPEVVTEKLLIPCVGYRPENLRFLKFGSSC